MSKRPTDEPNGGTDPKRPKVGMVAQLPPRPGGTSTSGLASASAPVPAPHSSSNSGGGPGLDLTAIRAQIAARMASFGKSAPSGPIHPGAPPPTSAPAPAAPKQLPADLAARLAAAREKLANQTARFGGGGSVNPYISGSGTLPSTTRKEDGQKGGLSSVIAHPLLADLGQPSSSSSTTSSSIAATAGATRVTQNAQALKGKAKYGLMAPKFSSVQANARHSASGSPGPPGGAHSSSSRSSSSTPATPLINPYTFSPSPGQPTEASSSSTFADDETSAVAAPVRRSRQLKFNQKGKFIAKAEELRKEAKMDELRQRIADASRKAGLDGEFEVLERNIKRQPPPDVEWWDAPLLANKTYDDLDTENTLINDDDSLVTIYIQHPIPIPAPNDGKAEEPRSLMLTKKEQKKMRRQRRAAELLDKQDRQKMGLLPPDAPKIKLSNMMKVLTSSAVADPTKIEARVKSEAASRQRKHLEDNAARALTEDQKREKREAKMMKQESKGVVGAAFKIKYLVNGAHRFKIKQNAEQLGLHGLLLFHPDFALVYVEGSAQSLKKYKRLMTVRIDWTEEARPKIVETDGMDVDGTRAGSPSAGPDSEAPQGWQPIQERPESLANNLCEIVWEGEVPEKSFRAFRYRNVETDREAKDMLGKNRDGIWDLAKKWIWEGGDD